MSETTVPTRKVKISKLGQKHLFELVKVGSGVTSVRGELVGINHYTEIVEDDEDTDGDHVVYKSRCTLTIRLWGEDEVDVPVDTFKSIKVYDYPYTEIDGSEPAEVPLDQG